MAKKLILLFSLIYLNVWSTNAQTLTSKPENKIRLSIITPENIDKLDYSQLSRINSKFNDIVTQSGFSGDATYSNGFVVYPKILVNEVREADGGMFRIFSVSIDVTIVVMQYSTKTIFQSMTFELKGSGDSKKNAIDNAIRSMKTSNDDFTNFFNTSRSKIVNYFALNCNDILRNGDLLVSQKKYAEAFATYLTIPSEVECFQKAIPSVISAFKQYQNSTCLELLQNAKARFGNRDFTGSLEYLSKVDPESKCYAESNKLINECFKNVSDIEARNFAFLKEAYQTEKSLESKRIDAARDISIEYYRSRPTVINYNSLILF
jgi:hypothetical protein